jgi:hypothetical protein
MSELEYAEEERKEIGEDRYEAFCKAREQMWTDREAKGGEPVTIQQISDLHLHDEWCDLTFASLSNSEYHWVISAVHNLRSIEPVSDAMMPHDANCAKYVHRGKLKYYRLMHLGPLDCMDYMDVYVHHGNGRFYRYDRDMIKAARKTMRDVVRCSCIH